MVRWHHRCNGQWSQDNGVWVNSGSWWWKGRPGVLQFMGSQRVRHYWLTELNWTEHYQKVYSWDLVAVCAKSLQSCPTLSDPMDCSPLGSSVQGILQARILEWVAISPSRESSKRRDWTCVSCIAGGFFTTEPPGKPLSGGPVVKTPPSNAEGACLIPGLGNKVLHAAEWGQNFFNNNKI